MNELALFAGAGGGILGGQLLGWRTVCAVEFDEYARSVLLARQNDGRFEPFPVWDDVRTFDGRPWCGTVDVVSGGFPCQDISAAGKGEGISGSRSGLWHHMARIIREVQPAFVFAENSPMLTSRGLDVVLGDLAAMGFDAEWGVLGAHRAGAPHKRDRIWILARHPDREGEPAIAINGEAPRVQSVDAAHPDRLQLWHEQGRKPGPRREGSAFPSDDGAPQPVADTMQPRPQKRRPEPGEPEKSEPRNDAPSFRTLPNWWSAEPPVGRVVDGLAYRSHQLRAIGNGQVPACMAMAFRALYRRLISQNVTGPDMGPGR